LDTQSFCCYGCRLAGDVISFVCLIRTVRFDEALQILGEQAPAHESAPRAPESTRVRRSRDRPSVSVLRFPDVSEVAAPDGAAPGQEHDVDEQGVVSSIALLSATTALGMEGLVHAPLALTYLGERGISYALARCCRVGFLEEQALLDFLAGNSAL